MLLPHRSYILYRRYAGTTRDLYFLGCRSQHCTLTTTRRRTSWRSKICLLCPRSVLLIDMNSGIPVKASHCLVMMKSIMFLLDIVSIQSTARSCAEEWGPSEGHSCDKAMLQWVCSASSRFTSSALNVSIVQVARDFWNLDCVGFVF